jgi:excinuclease ABC subunit B
MALFWGDDKTEVGPLAKNERRFEIIADIKPKGDQPAAIERLVAGIEAKKRHQILMGVTGSGKTFTMANVIEKVQKPTLIIAHNKTLAAQLFSEMKEIFPNNAVGFFISYYDYYQPEAYLPVSDTYIAKDSAINDDIDKMRHDATRNLFERNDTIIVASVSCIYGLGSPEIYASQQVKLTKGMTFARNDLLRALIAIQYERNDVSLQRGKFRARGDVIDILPSHQKDQAVRVELFGDEIERVCIIDALTGKNLSEVEELSIYPNSHYIAERKNMKSIVREILSDLGVRLREFKSQNKLVEYQRLEQRTMHDVELLEELGYCSGIENYSRYLTGKAPGEPPPTLLDYFPDDFLTIIDESHMTVPQIGAMYRGDRARKQTLVDYGFRLPSALDNRPLNFDEFMRRVGGLIYVSATPGKYELDMTGGAVVEQVIRPTGLIDPAIEVRPVSGQVDDLYDEISKVTKTKGRVLVTTLTKRMAEDLTTYYKDLGVKIRYLHADVDSIERTELLRDLRKGEFDVLIGINLLREGLDLPEVKLVAVMDADKEGFLRSRSSLIQVVGRAARNVEGKVIFYAASITAAMQQCMDETDRRRAKQLAFNAEHGVVPASIQKKLAMGLRELYGLTTEEQKGKKKTIDHAKILNQYDVHTSRQLEALIAEKNRQMKAAAKELAFESAAQIRDELALLKELMLVWGGEKS